ncbi:hypothetical protein ACFWIY_26315 [Streptomyces sioyaensis]|uniref:hypothetical protein n=1 Tax=Streptomyces sioyaensis TaxID=67364 RepID=UPI003646D079
MRTHSVSVAVADLLGRVRAERTVPIGPETGRSGGDELADRVAGQLARLSPLRTEVRAGAVGGRAVLHGAVLAAREAAQDELFAPAD